MDDVVFMVRAGSRADCLEQLRLLCERMGLQPATTPTDSAGRGWVARAVPMTKAPDADQADGALS
ncbi:hypothetical protein [Streptomyces sp. cg35]|uniref:hypothetical protein n=1 Tax=Streptomyces sp. cg35 TaxID=3421650 RepID=UPI003D1640D3